MVLLGDGTMVFQPAPKEETRPAEAVRRHRGARNAVHLRVRAHQSRSSSSSASPTTMLEPVALDSRAYRRGLAVFEEGVPKSFNLDLSDLSRDVWSLLPQPGDFVAEVQDAPLRRPDLRAIERRGRRRHDVPARAASATSAPTRRSRSCRAAAASSTKTTTSTTTCSTTTSTRRSIPSASGWKAGRGCKLRVKSHAHRRADAALCRQPERVVGDERRVRPPAVPARAQPEQRARQPAVAGGARFPADADDRLLGPPGAGRASRTSRSTARRCASGQRNAQPDDVPLVPPEPKWLFSNRNYWYPQNQVTDYATARIRLTVPAEYRVVASGILEDGLAEPRRPPAPSRARRASFRAPSYSFTAPQPVRYLGV